MPLKVLAKREVVSSEGNLVHLNVKSLTLEQKAHIRSLCEQKLQEYVQKKGLGNPIPTDFLPAHDEYVATPIGTEEFELNRITGRLQEKN